MSGSADVPLPDEMVEQSVLHPFYQRLNELLRAHGFDEHENVLKRLLFIPAPSTSVCGCGALFGVGTPRSLHRVDCSLPRRSGENHDLRPGLL